MARYDFRCQDCDRIIEIERPISDICPVICSECNQEMNQYFGRTRLRFKGPVLDFFDKANGRRFDNQRQMREYERENDAYLLSNEEIKQEFEHRARRREEAESEKSRKYIEKNMRRIMNAQ